MRTLAVTQNITIDGVIDNTTSWFGPGDDLGDLGDVLEVNREQRERADAFLVGRTTFEEMRGYWPHQHDDTTGISAYLDAVHKHVVSSTLDDPAWEPTSVLRGEVGHEVSALKAAPGADIVVTGSITLVHELIRLGLVDEFRLFVYPVVVGEGRRLFEDATDVPPLTLREVRGFTSGIVLQRYRLRSR